MSNIRYNPNLVRSYQAPAAPVAPAAPNYHAYFAKVLSKRLKYVNNINIILSIVISISLRVPYGDFWWNLLFTVARAPVIFLGLLLIKQARIKFSTVEISPYKTLGSQVYHTYFSLNYIKNSIFYVLSALFIHAIYTSQLPQKFDWYLQSKEFRSSPVVNDEWVYLWYYPFFLATFYSGHHLVFQRNRLVFQYGSQKSSPDKTLLSKVPSLFANALVLNVFVGILSPVTYYLIRPIIYKSNILLLLILGLDTNVPELKISFKTMAELSYLSYQVLLLWEIVNHSFNVYATIGCLDGKKLISTYNADPLSTLLNGLRNLDPNQQLSRLSAFQELAYISTTDDPQGIKLRAAIYSTRSKKTFILAAILEECSLVIKDTTARIDFRTSRDLKALKKEQSNKDQQQDFTFKGSPSIDDSEIFGNSFVSASGGDSPQRSNLRSYQTSQELPKKPFQENPLYKIFELQVLVPVKSILSSIFDVQEPPKKGPTVIIKIQSVVQKVYDALAKYNGRFLSTNIGIFFRATLKRDTGSRIVNPVNFGNAIISVSNLLIHSIEEDKISAVTNEHIRDVLELLEKPIRATSNYTDFIPASVYLTESQKADKKALNNHLIVVLHDLTMREFFQLCVKFNYKLNDMVLSPKTYKLAKWVIDVAFAQQQQQSQQQKKQGTLLK